MSRPVVYGTETNLELQIKINDQKLTEHDQLLEQYSLAAQNIIEKTNQQKSAIEEQGVRIENLQRRYERIDETGRSLKIALISIIIFAIIIAVVVITVKLI